MKKFKLWHLAIICLAVFLIFGGIAAAVISTSTKIADEADWSIPWLGFKSFGVRGDEFSIDQTETAGISGKNDVVIRSVSSQIEVKETTDDEITAHLFGDYYSRRGEIELEVTDSGGTVKIAVKYPKGNTGITISDLKLEVTIPQDYEGDLAVSSVSGPLYISCESMELDKVHFSTTSGRINFEPINSSILEANSVSGRIEGTLLSGKLNAHGTSSSISISGLTAESEVRTVSGRITVDVEDYDDLNLSSTSGRVEINLKAEGDFYVDFSTTSGSFDSDIPLMVESQKRNGFEGYLGDSSAPRFKVNTVSGSLHINKDY
jgi:lia operon protein LiaG